MLTVAAKPLPWMPATPRHVMAQGMSLAEIVAAWPEPLPEAWDEFGVVCVNGEPIMDRAWWPHVRPRDNGPIPVEVLLVMLPQNGGVGRQVKNIASIVGSIALVAATAWIGAGNIPLLGGLGSKLLAAGLGIAGKLLLNALSPPPPKQQGQSAQQTAQAGAQINILAPGGQLPTVLGRMRVAPPGLVVPYTLLSNSKLYTHVIVGLAGRHAVSDIRINNVAITDMKGVTSQVKKGLPNDSKLTLCASTVLEQQVQQRASTFETDGSDAGILKGGRYEDVFPTWHIFNSRGTPEELRIRLLWPSGLYYTDSKGEQSHLKQYVRVRIRRKGTTTWHRLPTAIFESDSQAELRREIRLVWTTATANYAAPMTGPHYGGGMSSHCVAEFFETNTGVNLIDIDFPADTDAYFRSSVRVKGSAAYGYWAKYARGSLDGLKYYLHPGQYPKGDYEVQVRFGYPIDKAKDTLGSNVDPIPKFSFCAYETGQAGYKPRIVVYPNSSSAVYIESFTTMRSDYPLGFTGGHTLIALKVRNIQISSLSAVFQKECPVYSAGNWNTVSPSQNPADMLRHILLDALNKEPVPSAMIDNDSIVAFRSWCYAQGLTCNALIDGATVEQALMIAAASGHATLRRSDTYGVFIEKSRSADAITQVFTPRNTRNNQITKDFPDPVHAFRVSFFDEDDDFKEKELIVTADGITLAAATLIEAISYPGKTNGTEVRRRAKLDLRQLRLRPRRYSFETDAQYLVCQRGDLVSYTFDVVDKSTDYAWITGITRNSAGLVVGLTLDAAVFQAQTGGIWAPASIFSPASLFEATATPGILLRRNNGAAVRLQVRENSLSNALTLVTPQSIPDADLLNALVVAGIFGSESRRCIVWDIQPSGDGTAAITLVDEAPGIPT